MNHLKSLYQEVILDHSKKPRNFGALDAPTHTARGHNPLCGDSLKIFAVLENEVITQLKFVGEGCAISKASASLMTEMAKGKTLAEFAQLYEAFHHVVTSDEEVSDNMGKLAVLAGVREYPSRVKCATLAWHTLDAAIKQQEIAQTE